MLKRCHNEKCDTYRYYGGRGIRVCERWKDFRNFLADMGPRPTPQHSIDRLDVNGDYEPDNCRWATSVEQAQNTRTARVFTIDDKSQSIAAWARERGVKHTTVLARIKRGLSIEEALRA